jgi:hypothetical protein
MPMIDVTKLIAGSLFLPRSSMRSLKPIVITSLFGILFNISAAETLAQTSSDPIYGETSVRQSLATHLAAPNGLRSIGRVPRNQSMDLTLTLKPRNPEQLKSVLQNLYDPASPNYRHFLTAEQFTQQFGPTEDDAAQVRAFALSHGLTVTNTSASRLVIHVSGSVEAVERTFGVKMQVYHHPTETRNFYAPDVEPSLDTNIPVQGITGLSTQYLLHLASHQQFVASNVQTNEGSGQGGSFLASDLRNAYVPGVSLDGSGQTIGIFAMGGYNLSDIQGYFSNQGKTLNVPIVNVLLDGMNGICGTSCDDSEAGLDIEMALSLAPNLSAVVFYEGSTPLDILDQMATDNIARQLSCSYVFAPDPASYEPVFQEFAAQGQSFFASSGDGGAFSLPGCTGNCWNSLFPADDPWVTAVGGTVLTTSSAGGAWASESAWPYSGGGINDFGYPIADYQSSLINASNEGSTTLRNIPDVAAVATNVYAEFNGDQGSAGGTSASSPIWASFMALVNQQANGQPIGFLNPSIYALAAEPGYSNDFHDIASGNNFNSFSPNLFSAVSGYDLATGLGSPNGQNLIDALSPVATTPNFSLVSSSSSNPINILQGAQESVQISLLPSNGFTGTVNLSAIVIGAVPGATVSLSPSSISGSITSSLTITTTRAVASPFILIGVTGTSGTLMQNLYLPIAVQLPNLSATAVSAPPVSITPGATFSVTDTTANVGQAPAGPSVTQLYLSDSTSQNGFLFPVGTRTVGALAAGATSQGTTTATVPSGIWPNTPYYLLACANATNSVIQAASGNCVASSTTALYSVASTQTATTLVVTSSGGTVTQVSAGAAVALTANVTSGSTPINPGMVKFCDATATYCTDSHLLGTAQLKSDGTATLHFIPGIGSHSYKAVFAGASAFASSSSSSSSLTVNGSHSSTTSVAMSGSTGSYSLTATVSGMGGPSAPGGSVSFLDSSNSNSSLGAASLVAGSPSMNWQNLQNPAAGADPQGIAVGDFNGDGIPDLAIANRNDGTVTILLGNGDGTFTAGTIVSNVPSAQAIAVADFNGDGNLDLAVTNSELNSVTILLGNGKGAFTVASVFSTGVLPAGIAVGDLNGDGLPDLAVANYANNTISIFLSNGDGTFTTAPVINMQGAPQSIAVADFNGDGKADLAVAVARPNNESVVILLGNGDGTFTPASQSLPVGEYPSSIVSADFNGDGKPDLAVTISETNSVAVFLGKGDGTFNAVSSSPSTGNYPLSLVTADFNGDGQPDLAIANAGDSTITILLGQGNGNFSASSINLSSGVSPLAIATADLNGDGYADLSTANELGDSASIFVAQWQQTATATLNEVDPMSAGYHLVEASYPGDSNFAASASATVTLLGAAPPAVTVTPSSTSITTAQSLNVSITVSGIPTPSGTVVLTSGSFTSATTALANGSATFIVSAGSLAIGSDTLTASYTPDPSSSSTYQSATGSSSTVTVTQAKTTPTISWATPAAIAYGTALSATQLIASSGGVAGSFAYTPVSGTVLGAGKQTLSVTFTPTDTTDYNTGSATVTLTVNQATPTISWATPATITFGTALSSAQLDAIPSVPGTLTYNSAAGTTPAVGSDTLSVSFTPTDATDYTTASATVTLVVSSPPNPLPSLNSMSPAFSTVGGPAFTLTLTGTGFVSGSSVYWGTTALSTQFTSSTQLTAQVTAAEISNAGMTAVSVQSPEPGGGTSNALQFEVDSAGSGSGVAPSFTTLTASVTAGVTASYPVTLSTSATNVSVTCLNLPAGATCSYSSSTGAVTIATSSTTPKGTYQITVVFTGTLPGSAAAFVVLPLLLLPLLVLRKRIVERNIWFTACLALVILAGVATAVGCGGSGSTPVSPTNPTHEATSSAGVTLTIQ